MKQTFLLTLFFFSLYSGIAQQQVIPLYSGAAPGSEDWTWTEQENDSNAWNTKVVYNVSKPTLNVFLPDSAVPATGTGIVICPGGGFHALSINNEGYEVARWLAKKGITCFVLKYRLARTMGTDPVQEWMAGMGTKEGRAKDSAAIRLAIADGKAAVNWVRSHAAEYNLQPNQVGIMGFSAGGTVAASAAFNYTADNKPAFTAPIYAYMPPQLMSTVEADAPPLFAVAATNDGLGLAPHSVNLYSTWLAAKQPAELHMYVQGDHGFGMHRQNLPTDSWIERFGDWLHVMGFAKGANAITAQQAAGMQNMLKDWPNMQRYSASNKEVVMNSNKSPRVVFMGNSITEGWMGADSLFFTQNNYIDRGISGQTTPQMLLRFRQDVIDLKPAAVVILAGINDIAQNTGYIPLEHTFGNIVSMAQLARANGIKVVISSVLPAYDFPWRPGLQPADKVVKLNAMLKDYTSKNGMVYLDYFSAMADDRNGLPKELAYDGIHPTLAGYKLMEPLVQKAIDEAIKRK